MPDDQLPEKAQPQKPSRRRPSPDEQSALFRSVVLSLQNPEFLSRLPPRLGTSDEEFPFPAIDGPQSLGVEVQAQRNRAERLRESDSFRAALDVVRATPEIWSAVKDVLRRGPELRERTSSPDQRHRTFTPLVSGLVLDERARRLIEMAIDDTVAQTTIAMRAAVASGRNYVPEVVVGSGWHSAVYNAAAEAADPDRDSLTIDGSPRIGGQFAQPGSSVWNLNSRNRPENPELPNRPGTISSLNTMGDRAPIQESDVHTMSYGDQGTLATVIRLNNTLSGTAAANTQLTGIRSKGFVVANNPGDFVAILRYRDTGEVVEVATDRIVVTSGLGEERPVFTDTSTRTKRLLQDEARKPLKEKRLLSYADFVALAGNETDPFPFQDWKNVAVIGAGDGGRVVVGKVLGYQTPNRKSVQNLDRVAEVTWVGQEAISKEVFEENERPLYKLLGVEFPREGEQNYHSRIKPVDGRAQDVREEVINGRPTGRLVLTTRDESGVVVAETVHDHIVTAPGFIDRTQEMLCTLQSETITSPNAIQRETEDPQSGLQINLKDGTRIEIVDRDGDVVSYRFSYPDMQFRVSALFLEGFMALTRSLLTNNVVESVKKPSQTLTTELVYADGRILPEATTILNKGEITARRSELSRVPGVRIEFGSAFSIRLDAVDRQAETIKITTSLPFGGPTTSQTLTFSEFDEQDLFADATAVEVPFQPQNVDLSLVEPIARKVRGYEIYFAGPAARLPLTEAEIEAAPVLGRIGENTVAGFRFVGPVQRLAETLHGGKRAPRFPRRADPSLRLMPAIASSRNAAVKLGKPACGRVTGLTIVSPKPDALPVGANRDDLARYVVSQWSQRHEFPRDEQIDLSFRVRRVDTNEDGGMRYELLGIGSNKSVLSDLNYRAAVTDLLTDPVMASIVGAATDPKASRAQSATVRLAIVDGRADTQEVSVRPDTARTRSSGGRSL